jgi:PEP-CTERM motif
LLNDQANVFFRLVSDQTASSSGTGRIDDITVTGVPEPSTYAMLPLAGAGFAGYIIRRRRR